MHDPNKPGNVGGLGRRARGEFQTEMRLWLWLWLRGIYLTKFNTTPLACCRAGPDVMSQPWYVTGGEKGNMTCLYTSMRGDVACAGKWKNGKREKKRDIFGSRVGCPVLVIQLGDMTSTQLTYMS